MRAGVGSKGVIPTSAADLEAALEMGMDWSLREGYAWAEDKEHCEEYGRMLQVRFPSYMSLPFFGLHLDRRLISHETQKHKTQADPTKVGSRAKKRGLPQLGTLGAGNHYAEIQVVEEIHDARAAARMGIDQIGQVRGVK